MSEPRRVPAETARSGPRRKEAEPAPPPAAWGQGHPVPLCARGTLHPAVRTHHTHTHPDHSQQRTRARRHSCTQTHRHAHAHQYAHQHPQPASLGESWGSTPRGALRRLGPALLPDTRRDPHVLRSRAVSSQGDQPAHRTPLSPRAGGKSSWRLLGPVSTSCDACKWQPRGHPCATPQ